MNKKKTMQLWQMLVIVLLSAGMLVTMFLPAMHFNGKAWEKAIRVMISSEEFQEIAGISEEDLEDERINDEIEQYVEQMDENLEKLEEEKGIKLSSITPFSIMTGGGVVKVLKESAESNDEMVAVLAAFNLIRVLLWAVYILALVLIIVTVLSFCLKWLKYISLAIGAGYGLCGTVLFAILNFMPKMVMGSVGLMGMDSMMNMNAEEMAAVSSLASKILSCFWGIAFLFGFIIASLILVASVVSIFVGNEASERKPVSAPVTPARPSGNNGYMSPGEGFYNPQTPAPEKPVTPVQTAPPVQSKPVVSASPVQPAPAAPEPTLPKPMGLVKCTKGAAIGQGFSLPEDRKVVVGKSTTNANLVIMNPNVSNVHCSIRYRADSNIYIVKDHSTNGTFVNGVRLQKDMEMQFPAGTVLQLADGSNEITLG